MIQQTKVINSLNQERILKWAGKAGVSIEPLGTVTLEGAYPSQCRDKKAAQIFEHEYENGMIKATIITDMNVSKRKLPEHIKTNIEKVRKTQVVDANHIAIKP